MAIRFRDDELVTLVFSPLGEEAVAVVSLRPSSRKKGSAMTKGKAPAISDEEEARIQAAIAADPDAPEATDAQLARLRPAKEAPSPRLYEALTKRGRPKAEKPEELLTLRVDPDLIAAYKAGGAGWQTRMHRPLEAGAARRETTTKK